MGRSRHHVALVPARSGSRGLPGKNIASFHGRPLIAWTIGHALAAQRVDRVVVSTDAPEIARIGRWHGAEAPWLRPRALAADDAPWIDTVLHALDRIEEERAGSPEILVVLQPTSPLRLPSDVDACVAMIEEGPAQAVVSVCEAEFPAELANTLPPDGCMNGFLPPALAHARRQDLPPRFRPNGAVYAARPEYLRAQHGFHGPSTYAHVMPRERSVDIDDATDLELARALYPGADVLTGSPV